MKKLNLNIDFGIDREKQTDAQANEEIAVNYITFAIRLAYEKGIPSDKRRIFIKLKDKLDAGAKAKAEVEITDIEFILLKDCFARAVVPVTEANFMTKVEEALELA